MHIPLNLPECGPIFQPYLPHILILALTRHDKVCCSFLCWRAAGSVHGCGGRNHKPSCYYAEDYYQAIGYHFGCVEKAISVNRTGD
jgi:hypothetical protein